MDEVERIQAALANQETIVFGATVEVTYAGRAQSYLAPGDRLVIIKPDRTLLIHQPTGSTPVNYMKAHATHSLAREAAGTYLRSSADHGRESLVIQIHRFHFCHTHKLADGHRLSLAGTEAEMSDYLYANPSLVEEGFAPLSREEHTKVGFVDLFGHDRNGNLVVVECKRYQADPKAVDQLRRYVEKMKAVRGVSRVRGIIAAPGISPKAATMLHDYGFSFARVKPPQRLEVGPSQARLPGYFRQALGKKPAKESRPTGESKAGKQGKTDS